LATTTAPAGGMHSGAIPRQANLSELVSGELFKLRKRPMLWICTLLLLASVSVLPAFVYSMARLIGNQESFSGFLLPEVIPNTANIVSVLGSILMVVIAAGIVGSEYSWSTVRVVVGSGASRTLVLTAKLITLMAIIAFFVLAGMLMGALTGLLVGIAGGHDVSFDWLTGAAVGDIAMMTLGATVQLIVSAAIGFSVAVVTRSLAAGIAIGIGYSIVESIIAAILNAIGGVAETISSYLLSTNSNRIAAINTFGEPFIADNAPGLLQAFVVLTVYTIVLLALAYLIFRRRDIPSGS
jgi:ABC-2 type transport system permease protein